ncbi:MAG: tRNA (adenosine(37)-N6)-threonylcarbamoyltransferase complex transferase subunit TsaD [Enterobacterales bacterium]
MRILGIETSCDETGIAIYDEKRGLIANQLYSQSNLHSKYGGIVPELAARYHLMKIVKLFKKSLLQASLKKEDINGIAYTSGPGLVGSLIVGSLFGRSLAYALNIPSIPINHMEGHLLTPMLENRSLTFPLIALLISGGHTQLIKVKNIGQYEILSKSIDNTVGEAFDKTAKLLGLNYPGGPKLSQLAKFGIPGKYKFPCPLIQSGLNFSFSGLKTYAANIIKTSNNDYQTRANIAYAFEESIIKILSVKCERALQITGINNLVIAGGVSANLKLRKTLYKIMYKRKSKIFFSNRKYCTDNGAMIAFVGMIRLRKNFCNKLIVSIKPKWSLEEIK